MKARLIFDLNDPDDKDDFKTACKANIYKIMVDSMWNDIFRPFYKHGFPEEIKTPNDMLEALIEKYRQWHAEHSDDL